MRLVVDHFFTQAGQRPFFSGNRSPHRGAAGALQFGVDQERLPLAQLLEAPGNLGKLGRFGAGVGNDHGGLAEALDFQPPASHEGFGLRGAHPLDRYVDSTAVRGKDDGAVVGDHHPCVGVAAVGADVGSHLNKGLFARGQAGVQPGSCGPVCLLNQKRGVDFVQGRNHPRRDRCTLFNV